MTPEVQGLIEAADAARDSQNWDQAAILYRRILNSTPDHAGVWVQYGHVLKEAGDLNGAVTAYEASVALRPNHAEVHVHLGVVRQGLGDIEGAIEACLKARALDPHNAMAFEALRVLRRRGLSFDTSRIAESLGIAAVPERPPGSPRTAFDIADLLDHIRVSRRPTGIQRVQLEILSALLNETDRKDAIDICAFADHRGHWVTVPTADFQTLARAMLQDDADTDWGPISVRLVDRVDFAPPHAFGMGDALVNLGSSWTAPDYFRHLSEQVQIHGLRYVPFVHDLIPLVAPQYCVASIVPQFERWIDGVLAHAETVLTNSRHTLSDLERVARARGVADISARTVVVPLDGDMRSDAEPTEANAALERLDLRPSDYVLMVATVEPRKNHLAALQAWSILARRLPALPRLVCVGRSGWMNAAVTDRLKADPALKDTVVFVGDVSDRELNPLYRHCLFTLYPSHYEGWGLPVTESLCHGKVPLSSRAASLPEAGGDFAVYFDPDDIAELVVQAERLISDTQWREALEARISTDFRPRSWLDIARQITALVPATGTSGPRA